MQVVGTVKPPQIRGKQNDIQGKDIMDIYVGNLSYDTTEAGLKQQFEQYGPVDRVNVIMDKFSGKSKGFAFVTMTDTNGANKAIAEMNGKEIDGRRLVVNAARPREPRAGGFGDGGGRSGGGGGGGGSRRY